MKTTETIKTNRRVYDFRLIDRTTSQDSSQQYGVEDVATGEILRFDEINDKRLIQHSIITAFNMSQLTLGQTVKLLRQGVYGMSQQALADASSVNRKWISKIENDKAAYSVNVLSRVLGALEIKLALTSFSDVKSDSAD